MLKSLLVAFGTVAVSLSSVQAGPVLDRVKASGTVRVCIWPAYYGITYRSPRDGQLSGIDIDLSAELAKRLGVKLVHVDSSFASLIDDLTRDRCDVSMHAVGITSFRQQALRFSKPYLRSGVYGVTTRNHKVVRSWADIDRPGVVVGVQAGTYMEPLMAESLKQATMVVVRPPQTREQELEAGRIDVFMTDYPYSRRLLDNADWARLIEPPRPFHPLDYAYAVKPGDAEWLGQIDLFVDAIKRDGRLVSAARRHGLESIVEAR
jgi:ABC-type amino acid transport substrate-binding protein